MLLPADYYETLTGADAPNNYEAVEARVVALMGRLLDRPLEQAERSDLIECWGGEIYPAATPVVAVTSAETRVGVAPEEWRELTVPEFDDIGVQVIARDGDRVRLTYIGGYTPIGTADPAECPTDLAEAVAWAIHTTVAPTDDSPTGAEAGIQSMSVANEFSLTYTAGVAVGADGVAIPGGDPRWIPLGGRAARLAEPYRHVRVA